MRCHKKDEGEEFVMVYGDREFRDEVKVKWTQRHNPFRLEFVDGWMLARKLLAERTPAAILLDERAVSAEPAAAQEKAHSLTEVVTMLAGHAPTVVVGRSEQQAGLQTLLAGGTVDFVARALGCLPIAVGLVERRLHGSNGRSGVRMARPVAPEDPSVDFEVRDFGEILRHELNNPLTGILGNAELLLVELRRKKVPLPPETERRLETIATLAVRMRETVRRLSDEWEAQSEAMNREMAQTTN